MFKRPVQLRVFRVAAIVHPEYFYVVLLEEINLQVVVGGGAADILGCLQVFADINQFFASVAPEFEFRGPDKRGSNPQ